MTERNLSPGMKVPEGLVVINPTSPNVSRNLYMVGRGICRDFAKLEAVAVCGFRHMASTTSRIRLGAVRFAFSVMVICSTLPRVQFCLGVNVGGCVEPSPVRCARVQAVERPGMGRSSACTAGSRLAHVRPRGCTTLPSRHLGPRRRRWQGTAGRSQPKADTGCRHAHDPRFLHARRGPGASMRDFPAGRLRFWPEERSWARLVPLSASVCP